MSAISPPSPHCRRRSIGARRRSVHVAALVAPYDPWPPPQAGPGKSRVRHARPENTAVIARPCSGRGDPLPSPVPGTQRSFRWWIASTASRNDGGAAKLGAVERTSLRSVRHLPVVAALPAAVDRCPAAGGGRRCTSLRSVHPTGRATGAHASYPLRSVG
ncbi:MAG: hypothetical protein HWD60_16595 [Defluviicoccus sp.]|nr:MAG: hypothetical protein HWD60_16595 [Defluviicoccus sp.]